MVYKNIEEENQDSLSENDFNRNFEFCSHYLKFSDKNFI